MWKVEKYHNIRESNLIEIKLICPLCFYTHYLQEISQNLINMVVFYIIFLFLVGQTTEFTTILGSLFILSLEQNQRIVNTGLPVPKKYQRHLIGKICALWKKYASFLKVALFFKFITVTNFRGYSLKQLYHQSSYIIFQINKKLINKFKYKIKSHSIYSAAIKRANIKDKRHLRSPLTAFQDSCMIFSKKSTFLQILLFQKDYSYFCLGL